MADEEQNDVVEETPTDEAPAEEADGTSSPEDQSPADAGGPSSDDAAGASSDSEPAEVLAPRERRRQKRSRKNRRPKFTGTPEERSVQRAAWRKKKAVQRRTHRLKQREAHKAAGPREGTPAVVKEPGRKKIQQGTVVSSKNDKTITVRIDAQESHRVYKKVVRSSSKISAHDEGNDANEGDVVRVIESRPLSKNKRWRLVEVVERAR